MNDKVIFSVIFAFFFGSTVWDLIRDNGITDKEIPETRLSLASDNVPTITIKYCHSCGYSKLFNDFSAILKQRYPDFKIEGEYYEPGGLYSFLAKFLNIGRSLMIVAVALNKNVFAWFQLPEPRWWRWCLNNKIYSCVCVFFFTNMLENMFVSTGAFELFLDGIPIWSKIQSTRIPSVTELYQIIDSHVKIENTIDFGHFPK